MNIETPDTLNACANFGIQLDLPNNGETHFEDAAEAIRREYRDSVRWKRLRCRNVEAVSSDGTCTIFKLQVGHSIEFDWTWEGATAFRGAQPEQFTGDVDTTDDFAGRIEGPADLQTGIWKGEVVEVDETQNILYVSVSSSGQPPRTGTFFVRPFEFLAFLHALYCRSDYGELKRHLSTRLNAARGGIHPRVATPTNFGLKVLGELWSHGWAILWGPPGTGKTYTLGRQVEKCLSDPAERILVVSTTNRATDEAALAIGRAAQCSSPSFLQQGRILRIGKGANLACYQTSDLEDLLRGTETYLLQQIGFVTRQLERTSAPEKRALLQNQIQELRRRMKDAAFAIFQSPDVKAVVATAFKATTFLTDPSIRAMIAAGAAPFTTVIIDEAGLLSRAAVAALSFFGARRVVLVGDAKQLAPISKISRILPTSQATWLASSGLTHLQRVEQTRPGVHLLREQHRMHPQVSCVVSRFQYEGALIDGPSVSTRPSMLPPFLTEQPRAIWYVLDEDGQDLPSIRYERGPGNRSWLRPCTRAVLKKIFADPSVRQTNGLFITPFRAQAKDIATYFAEEGFETWSAGTVHSRQGTEADVVIFDTVNAGSTSWPIDEWMRLVNVGLSRAREAVILLASRAEMSEPYLRQLTETLAPRILRWSGRMFVWTEVPVHSNFEASPAVAENPSLLGNQLRQRKAMRPVMSKEQQHLCGLKLDGKPRLVRGVAGSGKTLVLAHWLQKTIQKLADKPDAKVWAVFANKALQRLIRDTITDAWNSEQPATPFPWHKVALQRVDTDILGLLLPEVGLSASGFDYDQMAGEFLKRKPPDQIKARCHAMFIDEAQDMGPNLLRLLSALVEQTDADDPKSRAINIFYDNAQNIYGRATPTWSEIGLDMRGRSTVMKESFRSTRPITEYALNVLYHLQPPGPDRPDFKEHQELVERGLIEPTLRKGVTWWKVRFNQVEGPTPIFNKYKELADQVDSIARQITHWIRHDGVRPSDICVLTNDKALRDQIKRALDPVLTGLKAQLATDPGPAGWVRDDNIVVVSTLHSFKGYEAEIVILAGPERCTAKGQTVLANNLYVAMTRARSLLVLSSYAKRPPKKPSPAEATILSALEMCRDRLLECPQVEESSNLDEFEVTLDRLGTEHRDWLAGLWKSHSIQHEPIIAPDGELLAEPLFWFQVGERRIACFGGTKLGAHALHKLDDNKIEILQPGASP